MGYALAHWISIPPPDLRITRTPPTHTCLLPPVANARLSSLSPWLRRVLANKVRSISPYVHYDTHWSRSISICYHAGRGSKISILPAPTHPIPLCNCPISPLAFLNRQALRYLGSGKYRSGNITGYELVVGLLCT